MLCNSGGRYSPAAQEHHMRLPRFARGLVRSLAGAARPRAASSFRPRLEALEGRDLLTTYVNINIANDSQLNGATSGLSSSQIYVFFTQENINTTWSID